MSSTKAIGRARVVRRANTLTLDLPAKTAQALGLRDGEEVEIRLRDAASFEVVRLTSASDALERLRRFRGRLPADYFADDLGGAHRD
ncbi:hypothetical protein [Paraburkholderia lycopersici]|uniref:Antitoxin MazE n=1 Tax=Paraburkholderia lycopersici TaxID=416944 RepID=A0A1G7BI37_9BURK|nr:hypothetical protein [Paraburkholderia lycopersici]SDE26380.1 antitoxin MazE [Paraburkholderia lycopersici]